MKKLLLLILLLMFTASMLAGCADEIAATASAPTENPFASTGSVDLKSLKELKQKNIKLASIYQEVSALAVKNGWDKDELTVKELNADAAVISKFSSNIKDPASTKNVNMPELLSLADDLIKVVDINTRSKVSVPFEGGK